MPALRLKFDVQVGALEEAVKYGRMELAKFFELPGFDDLVKVSKHYLVSLLGCFYQLIYCPSLSLSPLF